MVLLGMLIFTTVPTAGKRKSIPVYKRWKVFTSWSGLKGNKPLALLETDMFNISGNEYRIDHNSVNSSHFLISEPLFMQVTVLIFSYF